MNKPLRDLRLEVLMVEDNLGDVILITEAFRECRLPANLSVVGTGEDALDYLRGRGRYHRAKTPAFILLDLNLPKMDGRAFLRQVKADPELKSIPVIILTSSRLETDIREAYDMNANCYIVKPGDMGGFLKMAGSLRDFWVAQVELPPA